MPKNTKKINSIEINETNKLKGYRHFKELSDEDIDTMARYEEKVAKMEGRYVTDYDRDKIKKKYGDCIIPPFVLDMMDKVSKYC